MLKKLFILVSGGFCKKVFIPKETTEQVEINVIDKDMEDVNKEFNEMFNNEKLKEIIF